MMIFFLRQLSGRLGGLVQDMDKLRKEKERLFSRIAPPSAVRINYFDIDGVDAARFIPSQIIYPNKVVLYLHGGGYNAGSIKSHAGLVGGLAETTGIPHIAIDYKLAPEHPFPAGLDDAVSAYVWLTEKEGFYPQDIILMGDSAGGGLTLANLLKIRELDMVQPLCAVALSPWTDLSVMGESALNNPEKDPLLPVDVARAWGRHYAGAYGVKHPMVSPAFADLSDLAPMLIQVGTEEILLSDSVRISSSAAFTNTEVTLDVFDGMPHVWHFGWRYLPEAKEAIERIGKYLGHKIESSGQVTELLNPEDLVPQTLVDKTAALAQMSYETWQLGKEALKTKLKNLQ
jgi:monoterpene epsilon-lactone hydrolase